MPGVVTLPDGLRIALGDGDPLVAAAVEGRYELNELDFCRRTVRSGDGVLDLGAHVGLYTVTLATLVGVSGFVTAVEPLPEHARLLERSVQANDFGDRVRVVAAAVGECGGERALIVGAGGQSAANAWLAPSGYAPTVRERAVVVPLIRIDDLPLPGPITFIRADIEGAEGLALRGARALLLRDRPTLLVEVHPHMLPLASGMDAASLLADMAALGYRCYLLGAGQPGPAIEGLDGAGVTSVVFAPTNGVPAR